jgi:sugar phosphate isomerase/epimerase
MKKIVLCEEGNSSKTAELCKKYNLAVNIDSFNDPVYFSNNPDAIKENLEIYNGINIFSMHGSMHDLNNGSKDILIRDVTSKRYEYSYDISCKLGCKNIIFHNGYVPGTSFQKNWIQRSVDFWDVFLKGKDIDTIFYIENQLEHDTGIINEVINQINKNSLKVCLDIGHVNVFSKISISEWIKNINKNIGFVHLHNNYGQIDEHNDFYNGNINLSKIIELLENNCPEAVWALETRDNEKSIEWLIENKII